MKHAVRHSRSTILPLPVRWRVPGLLAAAGLTSVLGFMAPAPAAAQAARPAAQPVAAAPDNAVTPRTASLPAKGLFKGDQLSDLAKDRLTDLVINALGLDVEVALIVPTGPWSLEGGSNDERNLTEARLGAVRKFLTERGVEAKRIFVESRIDSKIKEPRLDVQLIGRPATN